MSHDLHRSRVDSFVVETRQASRWDEEEDGWHFWATPCYLTPSVSADLPWRRLSQGRGGVNALKPVFLSVSWALLKSTHPATQAQEWRRRAAVKGCRSQSQQSRMFWLHDLQTAIVAERKIMRDGISIQTWTTFMTNVLLGHDDTLITSFQQPTA